MLKLIIEDDEGRKTVVPFAREEITIGRQEGNTIRLSDRNVSRRHARLLRVNGHVVVEDLGSSNGTRINGERISGQSTVKDGDLIQIGDYDLALQSEAAAAASASRRPAANDEPSDPHGSEPETELETPVQEEEPAAAGAPGDARRHSTSIIRMDQVESTRTRKVQELEAEDAPRLVVVSAELKGQEFACIRTEMRIGRTDDNDIVIDHRSLSRTHAKIVREDNGEWRVIDMQSANGLTVNGESYAQASLSNGDVVELGHVKLRFVAAGEAAGAIASGGRSKLPMVLGLVGLLLLGGGAIAFVLKPELFKGSSTTPQPPQPPETVQRDPQPEPPPDEPRQPDQPPPTEPPPANAAATAAANAAKALQARIQSAEAALSEGKLDQAEDDLSPVKKPDGSWPEEVQPLLTRIEAEKKVDQELTAARKALEAKKLDEAEQALSRAAATTVFVAKRDQLRADIEAARKATPPKVVEAPKPPTPTPPKPPLGPSAEEQAKTAQEDALKLWNAKQYDQSLVLASKCAELDDKNPKCHKLLAALYARLSKPDKAAEHYRKFLQLAPNDPSAPRVREILSNYETSKTTPP
ncbi:FHA domain-containing protein [Hyalangium rubrum]|uniref:FHA domain-containing protein n=1 Tax=Hyalangium rubrum TaxID=3103134 RepID=A0ABU5H6G6_9BACT|nr:FHA domain-containing protein [Hyalangium sp. s54d21]MDY7228684.1 FHA domain-containing protein [Hyalangium sp. s54d21]